MFVERIEILVILSTHLSENHILNQVSSIEDGIAYKTEDHIKRSYQVSKKVERRYQSIIAFTQS